MTSGPQEESLDPTCILNGHSIHVEEAQAHIARISGELGVRARVVVTRKGDNISSLAAGALSENGHLVVAGGGDGTVSAVAGWHSSASRSRRPQYFHRPSHECGRR